MVERTRPRALDVPAFVLYIQDTVNDVNRAVRQSPTQEVLDSGIFRIEATLINLQRVEAAIVNQEEFASMVENLKRYLHTLRTLESRIQQDNTIQPPKLNSSFGRPAFDIPKSQLEYFLELNYTVPEIADVLGVGQRTITRRLRDYGLSVRGTYSHLSDDDLDDKVKEIVRNNKNLGYRSVRSRLDADGHKVQYRRVQESLLRVDSVAVALRFGNTVQRRVYRVAAPNQLWHFDGNHKLIRFKFVIHGCVDGCSRMVTFLDVRTNNRADTVLKSFKAAETKYGLPSRVRCDRGVENGEIVRYMINRRGSEHRPAIMGPSVHNQRIERLWVDVFQQVLCVFYDLFSIMVENEVVVIDDPIQMYAFQFTFLPIIQRALDRFARSWNRHPIRTEHNKSPEKLFVTGMMKNRNSGYTGVTDFIGATEEDYQNYGIDDDGPVPEEDNLTSEVRLDDIPCPVTDDVARELKETINPCEMCETDIALNVYRAVLVFLRQHGY